MSRLALTLTLLLLAAPAFAGQPAAPVAPQDTEEWRHAEQNARQALDKLMHSFDLLLQTMTAISLSPGNIRIPCRPAATARSAHEGAAPISLN